MSLINLTNNDTANIYPLWYFLNDSLMIIGNIIGISVAILFIFTIIRLDHPSYSISNLIVCNTSLAIGLSSIIMLINACYALKSDFNGTGYIDSSCILRGAFLNIFYIYMYASLCLKAFNRCRCIVYYTNPILTSYRCLTIIILLQLLLAVCITLIIVLTNGIDYDVGSHLCLITIKKSYQFIFTMTIYYISILFISSVYLYILYYVSHLPLLERCRRKRQLALLRRILILLIMLIIPGLFSTFLIIHWFFFGSIPSYSFKIRSLLDTIGYTGSIITIFISHTKIRDQYYPRKKLPVNKLVLKKCELIVLKEPLRSQNKLVYI
ncbi:unnamed protein product [Adineta steineri]|uniref:G-protein coupled receptors family 1 profile domain-containing protein n=1 Tax=Adineta steineri TaxID=433720 RepID=A0A814D1L2_9BILA|nr:unnamed protein product [Adineta steineri]CAF0947230.1 unnamed protein product [Adineta steineri]